MKWQRNTRNPPAIGNWHLQSATPEIYGFSDLRGDTDIKVLQTKGTNLHKAYVLTITQCTISPATLVIQKHSYICTVVLQAKFI
jgi:hypothetical protein